jgi:hypothetical protein
LGRLFPIVTIHNVVNTANLNRVIWRCIVVRATTVLIDLIRDLANLNTATVVV